MRLSKTINGETTEHVWDGSQQIIADVVNSQYYEANCYLRGTNLVATYNYQNGAKSGYTYYSQNAHGDVVNLTDAQGAITKSYTYDAFGVEKNIDDADTNAFRYCGEYYDSESGTIYLRARYYNPSTGRFISRDSYTGNTGAPLSLNLYTYCQNNPIIAIDPSGHMSIKEFWEGSKQCWRDGINEMKSMGGGARFFANYSEGIMDTLGGQINSIKHPLKSAKAAASNYVAACKSDIRNVNIGYYLGNSIGNSLVGFGKACYNKNWDSVAHQLGGATVVVGETFLFHIGGKIIRSKLSKPVRTTAPTYDEAVSQALCKKAPTVVEPGIRYLEGQYMNDLGRIEPWEAYYDEFGRNIARTDYNAGNKAAGIPDTHYHVYEWTQGANHHEIESHVPGKYQP